MTINHRAMYDMVLRDVLKANDKLDAALSDWAHSKKNGKWVESAQTMVFENPDEVAKLEENVDECYELMSNAADSAKYFNTGKSSLLTALYVGDFLLRKHINPVYRMMVTLHQAVTDMNKNFQAILEGIEIEEDMCVEDITDAR